MIVAVFVSNTEIPGARRGERLYKNRRTREAHPAI